MNQRNGIRRRVGTVRPSHLMFTAGVGGLIDLPNFTVLVRSLDGLNTDEMALVTEKRLLDAVRQALSAPGVKELRSAPWLPGMDENPDGLAASVGVPVIPFPQWLRCTGCDTLASIDSRSFTFDNRMARRPDEAKFLHASGRAHGNHPGHNGPRLAVPARFLLVCSNGHLDDFPYPRFVHEGSVCQKATHPSLRMSDRGGNLGVNVQIECTNCRATRNMNKAMGKLGEQNLPRCRGRHPHIADKWDECSETPKLLRLGASNQWFADTLSVLAVPPTGKSALEAKVAELAEQLANVTSKEILGFALSQPDYKSLNEWEINDVWDAIERHRARTSGSADAFASNKVDLLTPEWEAFTSKPIAQPGTPDFTLRDDNAVPASLTGIFSDVVQVERLRAVRALIGFTRLDAPDPEEPDRVIRAPISRSRTPQFVPASEVRGEGLFLRVSDELLSAWEDRVALSAERETHRQAYGRFRRNRYSDRVNQGGFDEFKHWPGERYIALHTLSHLLIRAISLECGYSSASLSERIYAGTPEEPRGGILIYTAVPDAEGSLGGLVALGETTVMERLVRRALRDATRCSSDPLCAERLPDPPADFLHGAACHVCLFVSETTCERGNRFLDRRFVVPVGEAPLALLYGTEIVSSAGLT